MATNKDIIKAALASAIATSGINYIIEHWDEILANIMRALEAIGA